MHACLLRIQIDTVNLDPSRPPSPKGILLNLDPVRPPPPPAPLHPMIQEIALSFPDLIRPCSLLKLPKRKPRMANFCDLRLPRLRHDSVGSAVRGLGWFRSCLVRSQLFSTMQGRAAANDVLVMEDLVEVLSSRPRAVIVAATRPLSSATDSALLHLRTPDALQARNALQLLQCSTIPTDTATTLLCYFLWALPAVVGRWRPRSEGASTKNTLTLRRKHGSR